MTLSYVTGGTLAADAPSYVERRADQDLLECLQASETCYVLNSRQMGKSSLCVRTILRLNQAGVRSAFCDLTKFGGRNLTPEQWYAALLSEIGRELGQRAEFLAHWKEHLNLPPVQRLFGAITELAPAQGPVVIFFDEIDVTLSLPFSADEFFAAIRQCYVGRATDEKLRLLSFCLLGTATPADLIKDTRVSPFNIGRRIELQDFTQSEAKPLAAGLQTERRGDRETGRAGEGERGRNNSEEIEALERVMYWTGGHPYLTQRLCRAVAEALSVRTPNTEHRTPALVDKVCSDLFLTHKAKESDDNLAFVRNRLLKSEADLAALLDMYRRMQSGKPVQDDETNPLCAILKLSGVAKVEGGQLRVRNRIYQHVFDSTWVENHMPDAEKQRQKEAYRRGVLRTLVWAGAAIAAMGSLAVFGFLKAKQASAAKQLAQEERAKTNAALIVNERDLYFARMNNLQLFSQEGNVSEMDQVLDETRASQYRGWEWGYWNAQVHNGDEEYVVDSPRRDPAPEAMFSLDGKQLLVRDRVLKIAFLIDRSSRFVIARYPMEVDQEPFPTRKGWFTYDTESHASVRDLATGKTVLSFDLSGSVSRQLLPFSDVGLIETYEVFPKQPIERTRLWDIASGRCVWQSTLPGGCYVSSVSSDRSRLAVVEFKSGRSFDRFAILDIHGGTEIDGFAFSNSDQLSAPIISRSGGFWSVRLGDRLLLRNANKRRTLSTFEDPNSSSCAFFDSSDSFAYCIRQVDNSIVQRSVSSGRILTDYRCTLYSDFCPTTGEILSSGPGVRVISTKGNSLHSTLPVATRVNRDYLGRIVFQNGFKFLLSYFSDPGLKFQEDKPLGREPVSRNGRVKLFNSPGSASKMTIIDISSGRKLAAIDETTDDVAVPTAASFALTLNSRTGRLSRFNFGSDVPVWGIDVPRSTRIDASPDGRTCLVQLPDEIELRNCGTGRILQEFRGIVGWVSCGYLNSNGEYFIGYADHLGIYDERSQNEKHLIRISNASCCDVSPDENRILVGTRSGWALFDAHTLTRICGGMLDQCVSALFTSDGKKIVLGSYNDHAIVLESSDVSNAVRIPVKSTSPTTSAGL